MNADTFTGNSSGRYEVMRRRDVERATGFSRSKIYALMNPNTKYYDPTFPTPIRLGGGGSHAGRTVVWLKSEVEEWVAHQISQYRRQTKKV